MKNKFNTEICDNNMSFQECELAILRQAVDEVDKLASSKIAQNEDIKKMINIVEEFLQKKKSICYGGTAINNILPKQAQFYNREIEIPDYDFYTPNALDDAKELADLYHKNGFYYTLTNKVKNYFENKCFSSQNLIGDRLIKLSLKKANSLQIVPVKSENEHNGPHNSSSSGIQSLDPLTGEMTQSFPQAPTSAQKFPSQPLTDADTMNFVDKKHKAMSKQRQQNRGNYYR